MRELIEEIRNLSEEDLEQLESCLENIKIQKEKEAEVKRKKEEEERERQYKQRIIRNMREHKISLSTEINEVIEILSKYTEGIRKESDVRLGDILIDLHKTDYKYISFEKWIENKSATSALTAAQQYFGKYETKQALVWYFSKIKNSEWSTIGARILNDTSIRPENDILKALYAKFGPFEF